MGNIPNTFIGKMSRLISYVELKPDRESYVEVGPWRMVVVNYTAERPPGE
jgi:hypothetical protein